MPELRCPKRSLVETIIDSARKQGTRPSFSRMDLSEAALGQMDLSEADFYKTDLRGAFLRGARLCGADLSQANLIMADLIGADLSRAELRGAKLQNANLSSAHLIEADLGGALFAEANLSGANLHKANLFKASLYGANLSEANLSYADLTRASLRRATLVKTDLSQANLTDCLIYGISAWNLNLEGTRQSDLIISDKNEPTITVDNLEIGQFIYLLLNNKKIRSVIDTITSQVVLILGRFIAERKIVLDAVRDELRRLGYLPVIFDFEQPASRNLTETVSTLAHMARFVIADITDARSIPQELERIVPHLPSVPVQPIILDSQFEYGMFKDFLDYQWVLLPFRYNDTEELLTLLPEKVIGPAVAKVKEIEERRKHIEMQLKK